LGLGPGFSLFSLSRSVVCSFIRLLTENAIM
jgi:hypothetical protein